MSPEDRMHLRDMMRERYAMHYSELNLDLEEGVPEQARLNEPDDGRPMTWK